MVKENSPEYIDKELVKADRSFEKWIWAQGKTEMDSDEFEALKTGKEDADRIYKEIFDAHKWLLANGYLRVFDHEFRRRGGIIAHYDSTSYIGLTAKGWSVARKYI
jgi:hypothetical protein